MSDCLEEERVDVSQTDKQLVDTEITGNLLTYLALLRKMRAELGLEREDRLQRATRIIDTSLQETVESEHQVNDA